MSAFDDYMKNIKQKTTVKAPPVYAEDICENPTWYASLQQEFFESELGREASDAIGAMLLDFISQKTGYPKRGSSPTPKQQTASYPIKEDV